mmetsp:Transcript_231/g.623  ORF Transcript_231/g.623 Transcript_231/m.623 type:complete len:296 (-) Transcript_231:596-1483(-)
MPVAEWQGPLGATCKCTVRDWWWPHRHDWHSWHHRRGASIYRACHRHSCHGRVRHCARIFYRSDPHSLEYKLLSLQKSRVRASDCAHSVPSHLVLGKLDPTPTTFPYLTERIALLAYHTAGSFLPYEEDHRNFIDVLISFRCRVNELLVDDVLCRNASTEVPDHDNPPFSGIPVRCNDFAASSLGGVLDLCATFSNESASELFRYLHVQLHFLRFCAYGKYVAEGLSPACCTIRREIWLHNRAGRCCTIGRVIWLHYRAGRCCTIGHVVWLRRRAGWWRRGFKHWLCRNRCTGGK